MWAIFTLAAAAGQTARNAMQRGLIATLGAVGATQVRFLFGLPFAILFLAGVELATGLPTPAVTLPTASFVLVGACAQIAATAAMLSAMRRQSFVVVVAFTKTEAAQVALFALVFLGDAPTPALLAAIALATVGVFLVSVRPNAAKGATRAALEGLVSAAFFGIAALSFQAATRRTGSPSFVLNATWVLAQSLFVQTALLLAWLAAFDRPLLRAILAAWRGSLFAGFMGAFASQFWFLAFAVAAVSKVRTLALVEVLMAQGVSLKLLRERPSSPELAGMALIVAGTLVLINA